MKSLTWHVALGFFSIQPLIAADASKSSPSFTVEPFEPPARECFDLRDKFRQPEVLLPPEIAYPSERRSGPAPIVTVLVQLDDTGFAKRLAILSSTGDLYSRAVIEGLKKARWQVDPKRQPKSVWFYFSTIFELRE